MTSSIYSMSRTKYISYWRVHFWKYVPSEWIYNVLEKDLLIYCSLYGHQVMEKSNVSKGLSLCSLSTWQHFCSSVCTFPVPLSWSLSHFHLHLVNHCHKCANILIGLFTHIVHSFSSFNIMNKDKKRHRVLFSSCSFNTEVLYFRIGPSIWSSSTIL